MARRYTGISNEMREFIARQKIFFVATASSEGRINLSPKGLDTFRVTNPNEVAWLNLTGSGNETAAHLAEENRMTLMFCAFSDEPLILRVYGRASMIQAGEASWDQLVSMFPPIPGARQVVVMDVDLVQTSCGWGVPLYRYEGERDRLERWAEKQGRAGLERYWRERNSVSLDGKPVRVP